eukprot:TRINITY_DN40921_c0_g1_i1.p1 TRINITY_DN40921_c0_g1~~TRINITY_DN40921_c0_g1_i1.p1  ORF type:complete len:306 (-),score=47.76 TRINITY_DN40921_c0_g1_i1:31-948(-)
MRPFAATVCGKMVMRPATAYCRVHLQQLGDSVSRLFATSNDGTTSTTCRNSEPSLVDALARGATVGVRSDARVASLAGALLNSISRQHAKRRAWQQPILEAMGDDAISRAINAVALCNRHLDAGSKGGASGNVESRLAFAPMVRVFVQRGAGSEPEDLAHVRRSMQLQLRKVPASVLQPLQNWPKEEPIDVLRVAKTTDLRRLSGLVSSRWEQHEAGLPEPVVLQAMGSRSITTMVRALAAAWQKSARAHEGESGHAGFACLPQHLEMEGSGPSALKLYSGVQCLLLSADETEVNLRPHKRVEIP